MNKYSVGQKFNLRHKKRKMDYLYVIYRIHGCDKPGYYNYDVMYHRIDGKRINYTVMSALMIEDLLIEVEAKIEDKTDD